MPTPDTQPYSWKDQPGHLPDTLWAGSRRSKELTPLMVQRYHARHTSMVDTWHEHWEMLVVFRGKGLLHSDDTVAIGPSRACLIPPKLRHREESAGVMDTVWIGLGGGWLDCLPKRLLQIAGAAALLPLARPLWLCAERRSAAVGEELDGLARALVARARQLIEAKASDPARLPLDGWIEYLHRHHARDLVVSEMATHFGCSERHFTRLFAQHTGMSPLRYLRRVRIETARKLMTYQQLSLAEVGRLVGYGDPAYFSRIFRRETGVAPSSVR